MYVKVETERLNFIRFNQSKLKLNEYIHLRDAIATEGDVANIGRLTIFPTTHVGSPRHMHEYALEAMTHMRNYGCPDLFITFTCNSKWPEITNQLMTGQTSSDRHNITARVFKQKIIVLMDYIVKQKVFGAIREKFKGKEVLIPRIPIIPTNLPFQFKRIQFPVKLAFAMTINKLQSQSLQVCGINLEF